MAIINMSTLDLDGKRVLIREDLNVPMSAGVITSDARIRAALATIKLALDKGAAVMVMSHLGRPVEGQYDPEFSLQPVVEYLAGALDCKVRLVKDYLDGVDVNVGEVVVFENVRFNVGEKKNDPILAKKLAALCDVYVMDAFGTAHRAQASTHGVGLYAPVACAGSLLVDELTALGKALDNPARPFVAIVGGSKVSTKLTVLESLTDIVDQLVVGGGIANTFIAATNHPVGKSLYEPGLLTKANDLIASVQSRGGDIPLPTDVVVAKEYNPRAVATIKSLDAVGQDEMIFDIGPASADALSKILKNAGTIVWNGPLGVFEFDNFGEGTKRIAQAIAESSAFSIAGGGDTLAAVDKYGIADKVSYISTGGGAFLEFLEGKELPAVAMLKQRGE